MNEIIPIIVLILIWQVLVFVTLFFLRLEYILKVLVRIERQITTSMEDSIYE